MGFVKVINSSHIVSGMGLRTNWGSFTAFHCEAVSMRCCKPVKRSDQVLVCSPLFPAFKEAVQHIIPAFFITMQWMDVKIWCRYLQIEILARETEARCQCCFYSSLTQ